MDVAESAGDYRIQWYSFDNATDSRAKVGGESVALVPMLTAPRTLMENSEFVMAEIRGRHPHHRGWAHPLRVYFRRTADGWRSVGLTRWSPGDK